MTTQIRDAFLKLASNRDGISIARIWRAMTNAERERALECALAGSDIRRQALVTAVAKTRHFRPQTVQGWDDEKLATAGARIDLTKTPLPEQAITALHVTDRAPMLAQFLNSVGIPNDQGVAVDENAFDISLSYDEVMNAVSSISQRFDAEQVTLYLLALRALYPAAFGPLDAWFDKLASVASPQSARTLLSITAEQPVVVGAPLDVDSFTTLDNQLTRWIVDAAAGIEGALQPDQLDDLLLEVSHLQSSRHRSYFHIGYRDALFERSAATALDAENESRRKWYWSGYITGIARRDGWAAIASLYDSHAAVRSLAREGDGPNSAAGWIVFRALCNAGRYGEASVFISTPSVAASLEMQREVLATANDLIRRDRSIEARRMLETLWEAFEEDHSDTPAEELDTRAIRLIRTRALCLRQLGEESKALALLERLLAIGDPQLSAIARTDIGLVRARVRRLGELALPADKSDLETFIDRIELARPDLEAALRAPEFPPAHANFTLGVLALAGGLFQAAAAHLEPALSYFATQPDVYRLDGTLALAQLYLGIALCMKLDDDSPMRACDLIRDGLTAGARIPVWLVRESVDALALARSDLAYDTAAEILKGGGDAVLGELIPTAPAPDSFAIRSALFVRAANPSRSLKSRAADYRTVLPWLLDHSEIGKATDAIEFLEEAATQGVGTDEYLHLVANSECYSPAWDVARATESRIRLYEVAGRYGEAAALVEAECHRLLASKDEDDIDDGFLLYSRLEAYGADGEPAVERLRSRVDALSRQLIVAAENDASIEPTDTTRLEILVVGGEKELVRQDESIERLVAERFPNVQIEFLHTGWSGNWAAYADEFERRVARVDGVVFLSLMRTMLGRTIRANCPVPRSGCRGRGQGAIVDAIARVIPMARSHLERRRSTATQL